MGTFGPFEIILIFLVILLIFGAKRIPEIARGIGKGIREFKDATNEISRELDTEDQRQRIEQSRQSQPRQSGGAQSAQQPQSAPQAQPRDQAPSSREQAPSREQSREQSTASDDTADASNDAPVSSS
jgi:sec-independent protein translocase protein TatA